MNIKENIEANADKYAKAYQGGDKQVKKMLASLGNLEKARKTWPTKFEYELDRTDEDYVLLMGLVCVHMHYKAEGNKYLVKANELLEAAVNLDEVEQGLSEFYDFEPEPEMRSSRLSGYLTSLLVGAAGAVGLLGYFGRLVL